MKYKFFISVLFLWLFSLQGVGQTVSGTVFLDRNANGVLNKGEEGIGNVLVSNGTAVVETGSDGSYKIHKNGSPIFPVLPSGYETVEEHWWKLSSNVSDRVQENFALKTAKSNETLSILAVGDIQVADAKELKYAARTIIPELSQRRDYDLSIFLGDMVNDNVRLFQPVNQMIQDLGRPARMVYGNHDRPSEPTGKHRDNKEYIKTFGPVNYAFIKNKILFITLNSLIPKGKYGYKNEYNEEALTFLSNIIDTADKDLRIVISQHIPLKWMRNKEVLFDILSDQKNVLVLSAHTHTVFQDFYALPGGGIIHELNSGAISGNWWTGQLNWQDIPLSLMADGTPRGYFKLIFDQNSYRIQFKAVGLDRHKQLSLWIGQKGKDLTQTVDKKNRDIFVNVYGGSERTKVLMKTDKNVWKPLERVKIQAPFIQRLKALQENETYPNAMSKKSPYLNKPTSHIWQGRISDKLAPGMHRLSIRVMDPYLIPISRQTWFWNK